MEFVSKKDVPSFSVTDQWSRMMEYRIGFSCILFSIHFLKWR